MSSSWGSVVLLLKLEADVNDSHRWRGAQSTSSCNRRSLQRQDMEETGQGQLNGGTQGMSRCSSCSGLAYMERDAMVDLTLDKGDLS